MSREPAQAPPAGQEPPPEDPAPPRRARRRPWPLRLLGWVWLAALELAAAAVAGTAVLALMLGWWLSAGPLTLDFLTPYLDEALDRALPEVEVTLGGSELVWDGAANSLVLRGRDVRLAGRGRPGPELRVPRLGLAVDLRAALHGDFQPTAIVLERPRLTILRLADGTLQLDAVTGETSSPGEASSPGDTSSPAGSAQALPLPGEPGPLERLEELRIEDAEITVVDRREDTVWRMRGADLRVRHDGGGLRVAADVTLMLGDTLLPLSADIQRGPDSATAVLQLRDLRPAVLAARVPGLAGLAAADLPISGQLTAELSRALTAERLRFDLAAGSGTVTAPALWEAPVAVATARLRGAVDLTARTARIEELFADLGGPLLTGALDIADLGGRAEATGRVAAQAVTVADLRRLWPMGAAAPARDWVLGNITDGRVDAARAEFAVSADLATGEAKLARLGGSMDYAGLAVHYFRPLPPVLQVGGTATFDDKRFDFAIAGGRLGDIAVRGGRVALTGLDAAKHEIKERADIALAVEGPLSDILALLDRKPLGLLSDFPVKPDAIAGSAAGEVSFGLPLRRDLDLDDVGYGAEADLKGVAIRRIAAERDLTEADLRLVLKKDGLTAEGTGAFAGVPLRLTWAEKFSRKAQPRTSVRFAGTLDDAARAAFGLALPGFVDGPMGVEATYATAAGGKAELAARFDLGATALSAPPLGWRKAAGEAATGRLVLALADGDPVAVRDIAVAGGGLALRGAVTLDPATAKPRRIAIERLAAGRTDLAATAEQRGGVFVAEIRGKSLDLTAMMEADTAAEDARKAAGRPKTREPKIPVDLTLALDRLHLEGDRTLTEVNGALKRDSIGLDRAQLSARLPDASTLRLVYLPNGQQRRLTLEAEDAGAALRFLDITTSVLGGRLHIDGIADHANDERPIRGLMRMTDYRLIDAPVVARLLNAASLSGLRSLLSGEGLDFRQFTASFRWDDRGITFTEAKTAGGALGVTGEGHIDLEGERLDAQGTIVPLYGVNQVIGAIPLLGDLLTGGEGQGVFAFTYHVSGPLEEPDVAVNPLSALAPGFLRNLFFLDQDVPGTEGSGAKPQPRPAPGERPGDKR
ncbi:MAG TPA: AsmA-like C-terminal domain-containing protein [Alphaproteobacteria bacterium]|nr:AsmA-like C-terminal domain-containing protein [Alphaproteobacteria bacterium]